MDMTVPAKGLLAEGVIMRVWIGFSGKTRVILCIFMDEMIARVCGFCGSFWLLRRACPCIKTALFRHKSVEVAVCGFTTRVLAGFSAHAETGEGRYEKNFPGF